ncbi:uncharacterized protein A4U43_C07F22040 [Asparagus officinalis]|uniref:Uncharacterized protein n=1 Tax=Asparagus officinalis TaxID=4686 RepID=A0A5P1EDX5_ASPOF|nr:uncharacterized protein A4U43_C07F22040 [Asparagus officinalis]
MQKGVKEEYDKRRKDGVVLEELRSTASAVRRLRGALRGGVRGGEVRALVGELSRSSEELERGVGALEEGVDGLYRGLVDVRMRLLREWKYDMASFRSFELK